MIRTFHILLAALIACVLPLQAQYKPSMPRDGSGLSDAELTTFKSAMGVFTAANMPAFTGDVTTSAGSVATTLTVGAGPRITSSGLTITVGAFRAGDFSFAGGTIAAIASQTQWLCVNLQTGALHTLARNYDDGVVYLAKIIAGASSITTLDRLAPRLPVTRIPRALAKLQSLLLTQVNLFGSSLFSAGTSDTNGWANLMFSTALASQGFAAGSVEVCPSRDFSDLSAWSNGSGFFQVVGVGPAGENAAQTNNSSPTFIAGKTNTYGNRQYTASVYVRSTTGTPSVIVDLRNYNASGGSPVKATQTITLSTSWQLVTLTGVTDGTTAGAEMDITCNAGGTWQLAAPSIRMLSATATNYGFSGTNSRYTAAMLGTVVSARGNVSYNNWGYVSAGYKPAQWALAPTVASAGFASKGYNCDLAIVGLLPNAGTDQLDVYEGVIRMLRARGVEVLLVTDDGFQSGSDIWGWGLNVRQWADRYGCAVADTAAFIKEAQDRGQTVLVDLIHCNDAGHRLWAESIAGVMCHAYRLTSAAVGLDTLATGLSVDSKIPGRIDIDFNPTKSGGTVVTGLAAGTNAVADLYGYPSTKRIDFATGEYFYINHPLLLSADVLVDFGSSFTATVTANETGTTVASLSLTNRIQTAAAAPATGGASARGYKVTITSGTMRYFATVYQSPEYADISDELKTTGTWSNVAALGGLPAPAPFLATTDTTGDYASMFWMGRSLAVVHFKQSSGGTVNEWLDGVQLADRDLYDSSLFYVPAFFRPTSVGSHTWATKLTATLNGSAVATTSTNHRLGIVQVFSIRDR